MNREHAERVYFEQLKRAVSIEAVLAKYGIELKRRGASLKGPCPIHRGSNPTQFVVSNGLWHCFGDCKSGGSIIELVAAMERVQPPDAALMIARWFAIESGSVISQRPQRRRTTVSEGSKPTHKVYSAQKREGQKDFLTRIGSGWPFDMKDGRTGLSIQLSALPIGDRIVIFEAGDEEEEVEDPKAKRRK